MNNTKKKIFICIVVLFTLLIAQTSKISLAQQSEIEIERARVIISDVIGLDLTKYNVNLTNYLTDNHRVFGGLPHEIMIFDLVSEQNSLHLTCQFVNNTFASYNLYQTNGSIPIYLQPNPTSITNTLKNAMQRYYSYSGLETVQVAQNMLASVADTPTNLTQGNSKLMVITTDWNNYTTLISWSKPVNGVDYPTGLMVVFNHNILTSFSDLSRFYSIGNTNIALSRDQAISIAQKEAFNSNILNITSEKGTSKQVTLDLPTQPQSVQLNAFCRQPLTYSPMWQIQFYASEPVYGTNGYQIGIWADTGQIQYSHLTSIHGVTDNPDNTDSTNFISQTPNTTDNSQPLANPFIILFIFAGVAVTIMLAFTLLLNKRRQNK